MEQEPHYKNHRSRLRNKFMHYPESLQEYEIVELLLTYVIPQKDVKEISKNLLNTFGNIMGIFEASEEDLRAIPYIKDNFITLLKLIKEINAIYRKQLASVIPVTKSMEEIVQYCIEKFSEEKEEKFYVIYLDSNYHIIKDKPFPASEFHYDGTVDKTVVYTRQIIKEGLDRKASAMIISHNHPNGILEPSEYDINLTKLIALSAETVSMTLYDHLIVAPNGYFSFKESKLL
ncbi:MAG TPA: DNA repair protein RadC [Bacteroidales bacterium]|jgi:DNA repair protein RadC|nr:DNA repair protein RadC [Bacteroidales bacterium]